MLAYFTRYIKYKNRSSIRNYMRGYNFLKKKNNLQYLFQIKELMVKSPLDDLDLKGIYESPERICLHQFLVLHLLNIDFNKAFLIASIHPKQKISYPLPYRWRVLLEKEGFLANTLENRFLWFIFQIKMYLKGLAIGIFQYKRIINKHKLPTKPFVYLDSLTKINLDNVYLKGNSFLNWVIDRDKKNQFNLIYHSVKKTKPFRLKNRSIEFIDSIIPSMNTTKRIIHYTLWFSKNAIFYILKQQDRLLFREKIYEKLVRISDVNQLPKQCYFHNSNHLFRPLWTYEAEKKGVEILFYFYSTHIVPIKLRGEKHIQTNNWNIVTWPNYLVWNQTQFNFIKKQTSFKSKIEIVGPIPFRKSNDFTLKMSSKKQLLVFDTQPLRMSLHQSMGLINEYHTPKNSITFLDDINNLALLFNLKIVLKRKRTHSFVDKKYLRKINQLSTTGRWLFIDPDFDAELITKKIKPIASISAPYSSTGIITSSFNIPTIYYDSTSKIDTSFEANNEICVLTNFESLSEWFTLINQKNNV